jgi:hypothetical protein
MSELSTTYNELVSQRFGPQEWRIWGYSHRASGLFLPDGEIASIAILSSRAAVADPNRGRSRRSAAGPADSHAG